MQITEYKFIQKYATETDESVIRIYSTCNTPSDRILVDLNKREFFTDLIMCDIGILTPSIIAPTFGYGNVLKTFIGSRLVTLRKQGKLPTLTSR